MSTSHDFAEDVDRSVALMRGLTAPREQRHAELPLGMWGNIWLPVNDLLARVQARFCAHCNTFHG